MTRQKWPGLVVSVPWPIRLFGDLQECFHLPTITAATDIRTAIGAKRRADGLYCVNAPGLSSPTTFDPKERHKNGKVMPSLLKALRALQMKGISFQGGFDFHVYSRVPGADKLLDSPVFVAAWTVVLLALHGRLRELSGNEIAELACLALEGEKPHGRGVSEIYACVLGGTLFVRHSQRPEALAIERALPGIMLGYRHGRRQKKSRLTDADRETRLAIQSMRTALEGFSLGKTPLDDVLPRLGELSEHQAGIIYAHLVNRDLCLRAHEFLEDECGFDDDQVGEMLDRSHEMLRDHLGFRVPGLERLIAAAKRAGALGCKINPGTDTFVVFAPGREEDVSRAIEQAGGKTCAAPVSDGMRMKE